MSDSRIATRRRAARKAATGDYTERRKQLLEAASRVFAEKGFAGTTLADIAAELDIDRGSLYYYVGSKADLFEEVVVGPARSTAREVERIRDSDLAPTEKLRVAVESLMAAFHAHYPMLYVYVREDLRSLDLDTAVERRLATMHRRYNAAFVAIVREGQETGVLDAALPPKVLAYSIVGMLASTHSWFRPGAGLDGLDIGRGLAAMALDGLRRSPTAAPASATTKAPRAASKAVSGRASR